MTKKIDDTPIAMAKRLQQAIVRISVLCEPLTELGQKKAQAKVDYECAIAVAIMSLKASGEATTTVKDLAKARCKDAYLASEVAESAYKSQIVKIQAAEAILNGLQSMNRYLDKMTPE